MKFQQCKNKPRSKLQACAQQYHGDRFIAQGAFGILGKVAFYNPRLYNKVKSLEKEFFATIRTRYELKRCKLLNDRKDPRV